MFDKWLKLPAHLYLRLTALLLITIGITINNVVMSVGSIWIISNWILELDFQKKWERFKANKVLWLIVFIYFFSILSIAWSDDVWYWFKDGKIKLPFLVIPLVMGTSEPLKKIHFRFLAHVFLGMVVFTSLFNYYNFVSSEIAMDAREMSYFISHVRFSILVVLAIFVCAYFIINKTRFWYITAFAIPWLIFYTYRSEVLNGYVLFLILAVFSVFFVIRKISSVRMKVITTVAFLAILVVGFYQFSKAFSSFQGIEIVNVIALDKKTVNGNHYMHDTTIQQFQDGKYLWVNICPSELEKEWNERSEIDYDSLDNRGQPMFGTIVRYMTSKDMMKDSVGVWNLTEAEIKDIENGKTSAIDRSGIEESVHSFLLQYQTYKDGGDPNGHSILQRLEHLKVAMCVIEQNWLVGVGTGDVKDAFDDCYISSNSLLNEEHRLRSHNQFLTIWVSHGILGLIAFILILLIPLFNKRSDYFTLMATIALFVSCLFQDIIETQAGVTIFGLFYAYALFRDEVSPEAQS